jgi:hypothetical protein
MAAANQETTLEGRSLRARFFFAGDRYAHTISLTTPQGEQVLLESIEGTPGEIWPPSPPLQSLAGSQELAGKRLSSRRNVAMLLGMAGQSHWSLAAELFSSPEGECWPAARLPRRNSSAAATGWEPARSGMSRAL